MEQIKILIESLNKETDEQKCLSLIKIIIDSYLINEIREMKTCNGDFSITDKAIIHYYQKFDFSVFDDDNKLKLYIEGIKQILNVSKINDFSITFKLINYTLIAKVIDLNTLQKENINDFISTNYFTTNDTDYKNYKKDTELLLNYEFLKNLKRISGNNKNMMIHLYSCVLDELEFKEVNENNVSRALKILKQYDKNNIDEKRTFQTLEDACLFLESQNILKDWTDNSDFDFTKTLQHLKKFIEVYSNDKVDKVLLNIINSNKTLEQLFKELETFMSDYENTIGNITFVDFKKGR